MKTVSTVLLTLTLAGAVAVAQQKPTDSKPSNTTTTAAPAQTSAAPAGPKVAKAKTKEEFADYKAAQAAVGPAAAEKAAEDFATKYPDSEMRVLLYSNAMTQYQQANDGDKTVEMGRKALAIDPEEPYTLITVGSVLAERTRPSDLDKDERLKEATTMSATGMANLDKMQAPAGVSPEQLKNAKDLLRSNALGTMGQVAFVNKDWATAEKQFRAAIDAYTLQPDPAQYLTLTLALDNQKKYAEALEWANKTLKVSPADTPFVELSNNEIERLKGLTGATTKPAATNTAAPKK